MTATQIVASVLLTLPEVAEMLRKSEAQLRWMLHTGNAPKHAKIGGRIMFRSADCVDWLNKQFDADAA